MFRRAAEIEAAQEQPGDADGYDPAAIEAAAVEVGLSAGAVRQALAELEAGALQPAEAGGRARSRIVADQRVVSVDATAAHAAVHRYLRAQLMELRRSHGTEALYRQREDLVAKVRRKLDLANGIKLDGVRSIRVVAQALDGGTLVRLEADTGVDRTQVVAGSAGAGTAVAVLLGGVGAVAGEPLLLIGALPAGAAVGAGSLRVRAGRVQRRREDVTETLAAMLDRVEQRSLERPAVRSTDRRR